MKAAQKVILLLLTIVTLALSAKVDRADAQYWPQYRLDICNRGDVLLYVALQWHYSPNKTWGARGWWQLNAGQCVTPGNFIAGPSLFVYAEAIEPDGRRISIKGGSFSVCVPNGEFDRTAIRGGYRCQPSDRHVNFKEYQTTTNQSSLVIDLWLN